MKNILLTILILIMTTLSFSQNNDLPQYLIEGGDTIGILLSIEQVQKLDNNSQLLDLFKQLQIDCDNRDDLYTEAYLSLEKRLRITKNISLGKMHYLPSNS